MKVFRRSLVALGAAAILPTVVVAALGVFYLHRSERERLERTNLTRAEHAMALVDARIERDLAVLHVLAESSALKEEDWNAFRAHANSLLAGNVDWVTVQLLDPVQLERLESFEKASGAPLAPLHVDAVGHVLAAQGDWVGDVERNGEPVVWLYVPVHDDGHIPYVLGAAIRAEVFHAILRSIVPSEATAVLVDRRGFIVARSDEQADTVGTPAPGVIREALAQRPRGSYLGETEGGHKSYSAHDTSARTQWSTHVAVPSALIDGPITWSIMVAALAGLGATVLGGILVVLILRNMAERRRAEEVLKQSQKMEAVGQLTGGIAHDFNNLLTAIIGNLDMIHARAAGDERLQRLAANALEGARRGAKLAAQLLAFSREQRMAIRRIDLQRLLNGMSGLLAQSVGPAIKIEIAIDPDATSVVSDANQLELALLNLAVNARDAMNGAGTLTITARPVSGEQRGLAPGDYVDIEVRDTGCGMPEEVRLRAIEPFFTTKPIGQGTGLGLSQVYGVVRESGGTLAIDSAVGKGTTVRLTLPRACESTWVPSTRPHAHESPAASGEEASVRVLVVDDDRLVRRFMTESLRTLGYQVTEASEGNAAVELLHRQAFDVLIVDFAMPGINGAEVARIARDLQPELRILIVSGYADSNALRAAVGDAPQLRKPFDMAELQAAMKELLIKQVA